MKNYFEKQMLSIDVNINGKNLTVNCEYIAAVPLDPHNLDIKPEPANIIIDKVLDSNQKIVQLEEDSLKVIIRECIARINNILAGVI